MKTRIIAIAAITSFALTPAALASDTFEFEFDFSPVEISSEIGAEEVYEELEAMIENKCAPTDNREKVVYRALTEECVTSTLEQAVADINEPELTAVHKAQKG